MLTLSGLLFLGGGGCTLASGVLFYLASRNQRLFTQRPGNRHCLLGAMAMGVLAASLLWSITSAATACFMVVLLLMVVCSVFPLFMAMLRPDRK
ncbi:hypothetical protein HK26_08190 [Acetobacter okinawensis]|uniref:Uncharacterized protein n=1 Tax=Acetobacter okinawensis TaxID=1076594 RepID=A0A252BRP8_9PROT|nr:hypothetical protein HK26_08190 [Acetobacter okinawensis]